MDFTRSEESQSIQDLAAQIFADQAGDEALKRFDRHEIAYHTDLWKLLSEAGLIGVALWRRGRPQRTDARDTPLESGDGVLLFGSRARTRRS